MKRLLILAAVTALVACKSAPRDMSYSAPQFMRQAVAEVKHFNDSLILGSVYTLHIFGENLIVQARSIDNKNVFQVISLTTGKHLAGFGTRGRAQNELSDYMITLRDGKRNLLSAIDNSGKFLSFDISAATADKSNCVAMAHKMPHYPTASQAHYLGDRILHTEGARRNARIFTTDIYGRDTVVLEREQPFVSAELEADTLGKKMYFKYNSHFAAKPDGSKFCNITGNGMIMEIWRVKGESVTKSTTHRFFSPKLKSYVYNDVADECIRGAYAVAATDQYIYCGYYDTRNDDDAATPKLGVFDWNGNPVCSYSIEGGTMTRFAVMDDDSRVYAWFWGNNGEEYLGYFDLK